MAVKHKKLAFTLVELLAVLAIVTILVGLLIPALALVRKAAKEARQEAQLTTIEMALTAFKNDYGDYPPSNWHPVDSPDYAGAQKLTEALVGWDLMGFHPDSEWDSGGTEYDPPTPSPDNLKERVGPYLELATANVFRLGDISVDKPGLFNGTGLLAGDTFVLCDVFGVRRITLADGKSVKAGTPILYYRANTSSKDHITSLQYNERIYNVYDNKYLVDLKKVTADGTAGEAHPLGDSSSKYKAFYDFITDLKVAAPWPYRPDSYLLITAGVDGLYGTSDDICNF